ncbi:ribokinase [Microbacterium schleiferi]|uniref:ribokinase n=1 Tax=Microbacterium schleiferi TaxID=69362 RepID=UPI00311FDBDC
MSDSRIVVVGSLNLDRTYRMMQLPREGESLHATDHATAPGGKGANQAVAAARLGAAVSLVGAVGSDVAGIELRDAVAAAGVDVAHVRQDPEAPTGEAVIFVDAAGRNLIVVSQGANSTVGERDVIDADIDAGWIISGFEVPDAAVVAAAERAHEIGARFVLNPSPFRALSEALREKVDVLVLNEHELAAATGSAAGTPSDAVLRVAREALRVPLLVVTLGSHGAAAGSRDGVVRTPAVAVTAVDTSGAGDAFTGAFVAHLAAGDSLDEALRRASAVGAYAVTRRGTQRSYPTPADLDTWLSENRH